MDEKIQADTLLLYKNFWVVIKIDTSNYFH